MNWLARPRGRLWIACLMLMLSVMCFAAAPQPAEIPPEPEPPPMLEPPEHLKNWAVCDGERVLYFTESGWIEFSGLVYAWAEEAVAVAATPLLIENAGLKAEVTALRKPRRGTLYWILGAAGAGLVTGLVVGAVISR